MTAPHADDPTEELATSGPHESAPVRPDPLTTIMFETAARRFEEHYAGGTNEPEPSRE